MYKKYEFLEPKTSKHEAKWSFDDYPITSRGII